MVFKEASEGPGDSKDQGSSLPDEGGGKDDDGREEGTIAVTTALSKDVS